MTSPTLRQTVICIRHGNKNGDALSELGIAQIEKVASELQEDGKLKAGVVAVYSSDTNRTQQSAAIFQETLGLDLPIQVDPRAGMQDLLGEEDFLSSFKEAMQRLDSKPMAGRTLQEWKYASELRRRMLDLFHEIHEKHGNGIIVILTHGPMAELPSPTGCMMMPDEGEGCIYYLDENGAPYYENSWFAPAPPF